MKGLKTVLGQAQGQIHDLKKGGSWGVLILVPLIIFRLIRL